MIGKDTLLPCGATHQGLGRSMMPLPPGAPRLQRQRPGVWLAQHRQVPGKTIIMAKCFPGEYLSLCPTQTGYSDLAPGSILQRVLCFLAAWSLGEETAGGAREEHGVSPSGGRPFAASTCPPPQRHLLPPWCPFILAQISKKKKPNLQIYL